MTTGLPKLLEMSGRERILLLEATLVLGAVRLALAFAPLRSVRRVLLRISTALANAGAAEGPERVVTAVMRASRSLPGATCLSQALTLEMLLRRRRQSAQLRIGFSRVGRRGLEGHAWVESEGRTLMAGVGHAAFAALPLTGKAER